MKMTNRALQKRSRTFTRIAAALGASLTVLGLIAPSVGAQQAQPGLATARDYPIPGGWFYSQESRLPDLPPFRGYTVIDDAEAAFWTEFRRYGGVEVLGYPVSRRYRYPAGAPDGVLQQAFQRGILQWRPDAGRADMANVFEMFTDQGKDDVLEIAGIPRPRPGEQLPFEEDALRRMSWITEPRFLARYLLDPVENAPFEIQEAAWQFFGLPQTFPERPVYMRERASGKAGAPLYLPYVVQRYQKAALQFFLDNVPNDPTIVPGDGKAGCVTITATGRLARRLSAGTIIPGIATLPEPSEDPPRVHFVSYVPPVASAAQRVVGFEMVGVGFEPGEPVTIRMIPQVATGQPFVPPMVTRVDATDPDGSFDIIINARVAIYTVSLQGERSGRTLDITQDPTLDLTTPTTDTGVQSKATYC